MAVSAFDDDHVSVCTRQRDHPKELTVLSTSGNGTWVKVVLNSAGSVGAKARCDVVRINETAVLVAYTAGDSENPDVYFVRSDDGGSSWDDPVSVDSIRPEDASSGVDRMWEPVAIDSPNGSNISVIGIRPIVVGSRADNQIRMCLSSDGGEAWTCSTIQTVTDISGEPTAKVVKCIDVKVVDAENEVYTTAYQTKTEAIVSHTTDGGGSWTNRVVLEHLQSLDLHRCYYNTALSLIPGSTVGWFVLAERTADSGSGESTLRVCRTTDQGATYACFFITTSSMSGYTNKGLAATSVDVAWLVWRAVGSDTNFFTRIEVDGLAASTQNDSPPIAHGEATNTAGDGLRGFNMAYAISSNSLVMTGGTRVATGTPPASFSPNEPQTIGSGEVVAAEPFDNAIIAAATALGFEGRSGLFLFGALLMVLFGVGIGALVNKMMGSRAATMTSYVLAALTALFNLFSGLWGVAVSTVIIVLVVAFYVGMEIQVKWSSNSGGAAD